MSWMDRLVGKHPAAGCFLVVGGAGVWVRDYRDSLAGNLTRVKDDGTFWRKGESGVISGRKL